MMRISLREERGVEVRSKFGIFLSDGRGLRHFIQYHIKTYSCTHSCNLKCRERSISSLRLPCCRDALAACLFLRSGVRNDVCQTLIELQTSSEALQVQPQHARIVTV